MLVSEAYKKGWKLCLDNFWPLIGVIVISTVIQMIGGMGEKMVQFLVGVLITGPIGMSTNWVFLRAARKERFKIADMFSVFQRNYLNAVIAGVLVGVFVLVGTILLIIPGMILAIRLSFVPYLIIDKKMEAMKALKRSWRMTKGHSWTIFGIILLAILIIALGLIALIVGIFFSMVWIASTFAIYYKSLDIS